MSSLEGATAWLEKKPFQSASRLGNLTRSSPGWQVDIGTPFFGFQAEGRVWGLLLRQHLASVTSNHTKLHSPQRQCTNKPPGLQHKDLLSAWPGWWEGSLRTPTTPSLSFPSSIKHSTPPLALETSLEILKFHLVWGVKNCNNDHCSVVSLATVSLVSII